MRPIGIFLSFVLISSFELNAAPVGDEASATEGVIGASKSLKIPGKVDGTNEELFPFSPIPGIEIPVLKITSANSTAAKRPVLIWWGGTEDTNPKFGRWLSQLASEEDIAIYSVGDRGVELKEDGEIAVDQSKTTQSIRTQVNDLVVLVDKLSKDPCVGRICVCGVSSGGAVAAKAMAADKRISAGVLISAPLDSMSEVAHFQRRQAVMAWAKYYGVEDARGGLTKANFESKSKLASQAAEDSLPAQFKDSANFYGAILDAMAADHFKKSKDPISIENVRAFLTASLDQAEETGYDFTRDPEHRLSGLDTQARAQALKFIADTRANNIEAPAADAVRAIKGDGRPIAIYQGSDDGLIPIKGIAALNKEKRADKNGYSNVDLTITPKRGHDVLNFRDLSMSNWASGSIPFDPIRDEIMSEIRKYVEGD